MEFLHGRPLSPEDLEPSPPENRVDYIGAIDREVRAIVERNWPHLLAKLPPEDE